MLSQSDLSTLRGDQARFAAVLRGCENAAHIPPSPVAILSATPHYSAQGASKDTANTLASDSQRAYRLGLCYALTGKGDYASAAQHILEAWASTLKQATTLQAKDNINFNMPYMIVAAGWIKDAGGWNHKPFDLFLMRTVLPLAQLDNMNNHGLWAVFMESSIAAYLNDPQLLITARRDWQTHIKAMTRPDGTMPHEMARSDTNNYTGGPTKGIRGLAYTHYALLPAALTAQVLDVAGQGVWNSAGGMLLQKAFGKAAGWTLHPETFPYYASNGGKLQDTNGVSYFPLLLKHYPNADAQAVLKAGNVTADGFLLMKLFGGQ